MKNLRFFSAILLGSAMVLLFTMCEGPKGDPGLVGQQGQQGIPGATGATGAQGPAGTANVIYSAWIASNWVSDSYFGRMAQRFDITAPQLTQDIIDKGLVLTYWKPAGNTTAIIPIPASFGDSDEDEFYPVYTANRVRIFHFKKAGGYIGAIPSTNVFRYIVIPGGVLASGRKASINYKNYNEVKAAYNLPD